MVTNSFYVMASTGVMAALGFAFWVLAARLYSAVQVGEATSLLSATALISYLSLLGFNNTFTRMLPHALDRDADINTGMLFVTVAAASLSVGYVVLIPLVAPRLSFVARNPVYGLGFVVLTTAAAVNLITDSVFIAYRSAKYNLLVDGVVQSGIKILLPLAFVGLGAYGIFAASGIAAVVAVGLSVWFMVRLFSYRPAMHVSLAVLRRVWTYSAGNYLANVLNILPILVLPLLVLDRLGAAEVGYYYVAFQLGQLLYAVTYAVSQTLLAEGGHGETPFGHLVRRSLGLQTVVILPSSVALAIAGPLLLSVFGAGYRNHGATLLVVLAIAAVAVALNTWTSCLLRITHQLRALVWSNVVFAVAVCGLGAWWVGRGLTWVGLAWLIGNLLSGAFGGVALLTGRRQPKCPIGVAG